MKLSPDVSLNSVDISRHGMTRDLFAFRISAGDWVQLRLDTNVNLAVRSRYQKDASGYQMQIYFCFSSDRWTNIECVIYVSRAVVFFSVIAI